jgi:hypothetical protein
LKALKCRAVALPSYAVGARRAEGEDALGTAGRMPALHIPVTALVS